MCSTAWRTSPTGSGTGPTWLRPPSEASCSALLLLVLPQLYGVGYPVLEHADRRRLRDRAFLVLLLVGKLARDEPDDLHRRLGRRLRTVAVHGRDARHRLRRRRRAPGAATPSAAGAYGLVGMGAVFAGAGRAPITAVLIIFELTGDYRIILPLMVAVVIATAVAALLSHDSIYTLKLRRRGIELRRKNTPLMQRLTVADAMRQIPDPIPAEAQLPALVDRFATGRDQALPVIAEDGAYAGVITLGALDTATDRAGAIAGDLAVLVPTVEPGQGLDTALDLLAALRCRRPAGAHLRRRHRRLDLTPRRPLRLPAAPLAGAPCRPHR